MRSAYLVLALSACGKIGFDVRQWLRDQLGRVSVEHHHHALTVNRP